MRPQLQKLSSFLTGFTILVVLLAIVGADLLIAGVKGRSVFTDAVIVVTLFAAIADCVFRSIVRRRILVGTVAFSLIFMFVGLLVLIPHSPVLSLIAVGVSLAMLIGFMIRPVEI